MLQACIAIRMCTVAVVRSDLTELAFTVLKRSWLLVAKGLHAVPAATALNACTAYNDELQRRP